MTNLQLVSKPDLESAASARLDWIDVAKALSILLVVIYHVTKFAEANGGSLSWLNRLNELIRPIRMPLFFTASAFFARKTVLGDLGRFASRFCRLAWVFLVWLCIQFAWYKYVLDRIDEPQAPRSWLDLGSELIAPDPVWFLWALALFFLLARIIMKSNAYIGFAAAAALSIFAMGWTNRIPGWEIISIRNSAMYFVFFLTPVVFPKIREFCTNVRPIVALLISAPLYIVFAYVRIRIDVPIVESVARMLATIFGVMATLMLSRLICRIGSARKIFNYLGKRTLPIYVIHPMIASNLALIGSSFGVWNSGLRTALGLPTIAVLAVLLSVSIGWLARKVGADWLFELPRLPLRLTANSVEVSSRSGA